jgi:hypothetical protein
MENYVTRFFNTYKKASECKSNIENILWKEHSEMTPFMTNEDIVQFMKDKDLANVLIYQFLNAIDNMDIVNEWAQKNSPDLVLLITKYDVGIEVFGGMHKEFNM